MKRTLGRSGIEVSAMGMGCWAIGGPFKFYGAEAGWGVVGDDESARAVQAAIEGGVNFFDTASAYGAGHSEKILGKAVAKQRDKIVLATKFGFGIFEEGRRVDEVEASPEAVRRSCEASLRRLGSDYIDLFQFHVGDYPLEQAEAVMETLESLVREGKIRAYGWSTDDPERAKFFAKGEHYTAVQHDENVLMDNTAMIAVCERLNLASINRGLLAMGLLTGKFAEGQSLPKDDIRGVGPEWMQYFRDGKPNPEWLKKLASIRAILTSGGRTLTQGALAWIWGRSRLTLPIPGIRTVRQAEENAGAMAFGPLTQEQMSELEQILQRAD
jgi:aryl-alcohol dehydrogenase-like predicted oxidoreductase